MNFTSIRAVLQRYNSSSGSRGTSLVNLATLAYIGTPVFVLFNLGHLQEFNACTSEGEPSICTKCTFFAQRQRFFSRPRIFYSRSWLRGTQGGRVYARPACALGANFGRGLAPWRALWAFKSRDLADNHGVRSVEPEPWRTMENPHFSFFAFLLHCYTATQPRYNTRFKLSPLFQPRAQLTYVQTLHMHVCCLCVCVCPSVSGSVHLCSRTRASFGFSVMVLTRKCKHCFIFIFIFIHQRPLHFSPVVRHREARSMGSVKPCWDTAAAAAPPPLAAKCVLFGSTAASAPPRAIVSCCSPSSTHSSFLCGNFCLKACNRSVQFHRCNT